MKIFGYVISNPDETPVLPDALDSLASFCDHIYLVDGGLGGGTLNHHPEHTEPLINWIYNSCHLQSAAYRDRRFDYLWGNCPLTLLWNPFTDPAAQRNWTLNYIWNESEQCDWLAMLDSDEVYSYEAERGMREYLVQVPDDIIGVTQKWLNLVQDEQHCVGGHHSDWLAHPRILRPRTFSFSGSWHEHLVCDRSKLVRWDTRIIHRRAYERRRLLVQRGHSTIRERSKINPAMSPFWDDAVMEQVPAGVTWRTLHIPDSEILLPLDRDALEVWDEKGNLRASSEVH